MNSYKSIGSASNTINIDGMPQREAPADVDVTRVEIAVHELAIELEGMKTRQNDFEGAVKLCWKKLNEIKPVQNIEVNVPESPAPVVKLEKQVSSSFFVFLRAAEIITVAAALVYQLIWR